MKFSTFILNETEYAGIFYNGAYYTLRELLGEDAPETILDFIRTFENNTLPDFAAIIEEKSLQPVPPEQVKLRAPIPFPFRNVICLGKNYLDHAKEVNKEPLSSQGDDGIPKRPVYFSKNANPAMGDGDEITLHSEFSTKIDYEAELAVIIGKTIKNIAPDDVEDAIFGYTIINDVTARDVQGKYGQWYFGKSLDGFCPMGPHIVTKDEIPFPVELDITCRVNSETRQSSNTSLLIYDIPRVISELTRGVTLYPGDIIATGTPGGVGYAMRPPHYLRAGDIVECEVAKLGVLTNKFKD